MIMKTARTFILIPIFCAASAVSTYSQSQPAPTVEGNRLSAGISVGHYRYDPGVTVEFATRAILRQRLSLRVKGGVHWLEAYKAANYHWATYRTFAVGLVYNAELFERTRFYTELGMFAIIPDVKFSDRPFIEGIYQFNGLEIVLMSKDNVALCLYLGLGPAFINAHAEKIEGNPGYGNGVHFANGLRVYF
jgi:hypothetical protein